MPLPLSVTSIFTLPSTGSTESTILPPAGVYFAAFASRLAVTWIRRARSPSTKAGAAPSCTTSEWRPASIRG